MSLICLNYSFLVTCSRTQFLINMTSGWNGLKAFKMAFNEYLETFLSKYVWSIYYLLSTHCTTGYLYNRMKMILSVSDRGHWSSDSLSHLLKVTQWMNEGFGINTGSFAEGYIYIYISTQFSCLVSSEQILVGRHHCRVLSRGRTILLAMNKGKYSLYSPLK